MEVLPNIVQVKIFKLQETLYFHFKMFRRRSARNFVPPTLSVATTLGRVLVNKKVFKDIERSGVNTALGHTD